MNLLAHPLGCIIVFLYSWGIVRSSLNPMLMAVIPPGYSGIYVSYQSIGKKHSGYKIKSHNALPDSLSGSTYWSTILQQVSVETPKYHSRKGV